MSEPRTIKISEVIAGLESGKTRETIRTELGITKAELISLFKHPKLKGRKTHTARATSFVVVDDTDVEEAAPVAATARAVRTPRPAATPEPVSAPVVEIPTPQVEAAVEEPAEAFVAEAAPEVIEVVEEKATSPVAEAEPEVTPAEELKIEDDERPAWNR